MIVALILLSVLLAATAQLTLKYGVNQVGSIGRADLRQPLDLALRVFSKPAVVGGFILFGLASVTWIIVLSRVSLSFAYPFASLTYVLILLFDAFVLNEPVSVLRWGGVALIISGLVLVSRTH